MRELEVPLNCFGPRRLRTWLYEHWEKLDGASRPALGQLIPDAAFEPDAPSDLRELVAKLEYELMLAALSERDFERFVAEVPVGYARDWFGMQGGDDDARCFPAGVLGRKRLATGAHVHQAGAVAVTF